MIAATSFAAGLLCGIWLTIHRYERGSWKRP
jgi:hypothetical protein